MQIILNCFRQRPLDDVLPAAREAGVGILARVPLASDLLSMKYAETTTFPADDHRSFNRHGERFDVDETVSVADHGEGTRGWRWRSTSSG
jgi:aryl-alcohol dehydrogenase-like predicted oxidoreductase